MLIDKTKTKPFSYKKLLKEYNIDSIEYKILVVIGELVSYIDKNAAMKNELNQYEDKRTMALTFVRQNVWVQYLLSYKLDNSLENLPEMIRNALKYIRAHLDYTIYNIHSPKLKWNLDEKVSDEDLSLLPEMRTDIVIENKANNTQLIIDTKYYAQTLVSSNWSDIEKIRTAHLFQILAYVNNSNYIGHIKGMLLYPTTEKEINANFTLGGRRIGVKTLNLDAEWNDITNRLMSIIV